MSIHEDQEYLADKKKEKEAEEEAKKQRDKEKIDKQIIEKEDKKAKQEAALNRFYEYKDNVKKLLLQKVLTELCTQSIFNISPREKSFCESLISDYIDEVGTGKLLRNMKFSESYLLHTIREKIDQHYKMITEGSKASDEKTQKVSQTDISSFWEDVDKSENIEDITNLIRMRVSNAEEDFINKNQEDKENVKTVLKQTAARIQSAKDTDNEEYADAVEESESRLAKNKIYQIQHEGSRNVFDKMVRRFSKVVLSNPTFNTEYLTEDNRLDMDTIVESVRCIYTLLETVATIKLEKVNSKYIENTINSIN